MKEFNLRDSLNEQLGFLCDCMSECLATGDSKSYTTALSSIIKLSSIGGFSPDEDVLAKLNDHVSSLCKKMCKKMELVVVDGDIKSHEKYSYALVTILDIMDKSTILQDNNKRERVVS